jgi:hypothetical protein
MGRSSGARPKKAVAEEVKRLKEALGEVHSYDWQKAQCIFDEMCSLCGVSGPSGGIMVPRSCRLCGYYGHTRQYCPRRDPEQEETDKEHASLLKRDESGTLARYRAGATPEQAAWIAELAKINARFEQACAALERGELTGCLCGGCGADKCQGCTEWAAFMHAPESPPGAE